MDLIARRILVEQAIFTGATACRQKDIGYSITINRARNRSKVYDGSGAGAASRYNDLEAARNLIIVPGEWLLGHVIKEDRKYAELPAVSRE